MADLKKLAEDISKLSLVDAVELKDILKDEYGIDTRVAYKMPLYNQPLYKKKLEKFRKTNCPISEKVSKKILNLPIYPSLKNRLAHKNLLLHQHGLKNLKTYPNFPPYYC